MTAHSSRGLATSRLIEIRGWLGLSQERFARRLCVSFATINRWERGKGKPRGITEELYRALDIIECRATPVEQVLGELLTPGHLFARIFRLAYETEETREDPSSTTNKRRKKK